jgi:DNA replication protein DnaC
MPQLLCIEGRMSRLNSRYADLLFEVVTRRYEAQKPVLLSTNKAFSEWSEVFRHAACVVTLVDCLVHRAEVIDIGSDSYRPKDGQGTHRRSNQTPRQQSRTQAAARR